MVAGGKGAYFGRRRIYSITNRSKGGWEVLRPKWGEVKGVPLGQAFPAMAARRRRPRWVTQSVVAVVLLGLVAAALIGGGVWSDRLRDNLVFLLSDEASDWTPAARRVAEQGVWMDTFDRWIFTSPATSPQEDIPVMSIPVSGKCIRNYGWHDSPVDDSRLFHPGVDIQASPGTPVRAALNGEVSEVKEDPELGRLVVISHGDITGIYGKLGEILVSPGQVVQEGEIIGKVGDEGYFHFEVRRGGEPLDPVQFFQR